MLNSYYYIVYCRNGVDWYFKMLDNEIPAYEWTTTRIRAHTFLTRVKAQEYIDTHIRKSKKCFVAEHRDSYTW